MSSSAGSVPAERGLRELLERDHERLDGLLRAAHTGSGPLDRAAYEQFRAGLLRHIGLEEKILLPAARRLRGGEPLVIARQLKLDHAALAALLVPTPTAAILASLVSLLAVHNAIEEGPGGMYAACEELAAGATAELLARLRAAPPVPTAPHYDGPRAFAGIERLLRAAGRATT